MGSKSSSLDKCYVCGRTSDEVRVEYLAMYDKLFSFVKSRLQYKKYFSDELARKSRLVSARDRIQTEKFLPLKVGTIKKASDPELVRIFGFLSDDDMLNEVLLKPGKYDELSVLEAIEKAISEIEMDIASKKDKIHKMSESIEGLKKRAMAVKDLTTEYQVETEDPSLFDLYEIAKDLEALDSPEDRYDIVTRHLGNTIGKPASGAYQLNERAEYSIHTTVRLCWICSTMFSDASSAAYNVIQAKK